MNVYKGKNVVSIVSSAVFAVIGVIVYSLSKGTITNIIGILMILLAVAGMANYIKYSIILDDSELKITGILKGKKIRYKDIVKIFTVKTGRTSITYIVDKYMDKDKWYIRGTYPAQPAEDIGSANFNSLSDIVSVNSYVFKDYRKLLLELSKKIPINCDVDRETWHIINA